MNKKSLPQITIGLISMLLLEICFFVVSCQQDEALNLEIKRDCSYLSVDLLKLPDNMSKEEMTNLGKAYYRLDIIEEEGLFYIKQKSGVEINISEELFQYFVTLIKEMNNRFVMEKIELMLPRTRTNDEGSNGGRNDCVAHTVTAVLSSFGRSTSVGDVSGWIEGQYGNDGVPFNEMSNVLNHYFRANSVPIPMGYTHDFANPVNQLIGVLENEGSAHAVTIIAVNGSTVFYRDDQNQGSYKTCSVVYLRGLYRIEGVR
nr:hypothetical protein [uncultured Bacteroides sp.]